MTRRLLVVIAAVAAVVAGCSGAGRVTTAATDTVRDPIAVLPSGDTEAPVQAADPDERHTVAEEQDPLAPIPTVMPGGEEPSEAVSMETPAELCTSIGSQWCADADGNGVPDAVEATLGYDPLREDCQSTACADPSQIAAALSAARAPLLVAVDGASAMAEAFGDSTRVDAARQAVERLAIATPDYVPVGLIGFGDRGDPLQSGRTESCSTITTHAFPGDLTAENAVDTAGAAKAVGWRPIGETIKYAAPILATARQMSDDRPEAVPGRLVLVTSGTDTCETDPALLVEELIANGTAPIIDVIALNTSAEDGTDLAEITQQTGGSFTAVTEPAGLFAAVDQVAVQSAQALQPALCSPDAGDQASACHVRFRDAVSQELTSQAEGLRRDGDETTAELVDTFAVEVDERLVAIAASQRFDTELQLALEQAQQARERFEQRYGAALPGQDLAACPPPGMGQA